MCRQVATLSVIAVALSCGCADGGAGAGSSSSKTDGGSGSADGDTSTPSGTEDTSSGTETGGTLPAGDFETRCAAPGVVRCIGFDTDDDFNVGAGGVEGAYGDNFGIFPPSGTSDYSRVARDTSTKASGASALRFTIPSTSGADGSGSFFANFSEDLSVQFGAGSELYVQWRQRFSSELLANEYAGGGGWKQLIIGAGDVPGVFETSCTALETVVQNLQHRGFPQMYNSCTGSSSHGPYDPFEEPFQDFDFKLQNARPAPYCLYSQSPDDYFPPSGNCFGYAPDEWLTFQVELQIGARVGDEFVDSYVTLWVAREGQPSEEVITWGPYPLSAGEPAEDLRFGKVWLLPYNTGRDEGMAYPEAYTWYDELVVSSRKVADPAE